MTFNELIKMPLSSICQIVNEYDRTLVGDSAVGNGNALDRMGRGWLSYRGLDSSLAFKEWLKDKSPQDFPQY